MDSVPHILAQIRSIGSVLPGTLEAHFTICGKPGCRCADKQNPKKHGPYYRLSYSLGGKNSSLFIHHEDAEVVREMTTQYRLLRRLSLKLALATLETVKNTSVAAAVKQHNARGATPSAEQSWKAKCRAKTQRIKAAQISIRDLQTSRDRWKKKCRDAQKQRRKREHEVALRERRIQVLEASLKEEKKIPAADATSARTAL